LNIYTNMSTVPGNLAKIGLVVSEIFLPQAIVKKKMMMKEEERK